RRRCTVTRERPRVAEQAGIQEIDEAPQLAKVVLDRRAAEREAMPPAQQTRGLGAGRRGVLDRLRLVEDHVLELDVLQLNRVPSQRALRRSHQMTTLQLHT